MCRDSFLCLVTGCISTPDAYAKLSHSRNILDLASRKARVQKRHTEVYLQNVFGFLMSRALFVPITCFCAESHCFSAESPTCKYFFRCFFFFFWKCPITNTNTQNKWDKYNRFKMDRNRIHWITALCTAVNMFLLRGLNVFHPHFVSHRV